MLPAPWKLEKPRKRTTDDLTDLTFFMEILGSFIVILINGGIVTPLYMYIIYSWVVFHPTLFSLKNQGVLFSLLTWKVTPMERETNKTPFLRLVFRGWFNWYNPRGPKKVWMKEGWCSQMWRCDYSILRAFDQEIEWGNEIQIITTKSREWNPLVLCFVGNENTKRSIPYFEGVNSLPPGDGPLGRKEKKTCGCLQKHFYKSKCWNGTITDLRIYMYKKI